MFKQFLSVIAIVSLTLLGSSKADCGDDLEPRVTAGSSSDQLRREASRLAEDLLNEVASWLASNFDLPAIKDRPAIEFTSKAKLATMHASDRAHWQGLTQNEGIDRLAPRTVVALYDNNSKTIFLPDDWIGKSPADQSVLVHEMV